MVEEIVYLSRAGGQYPFVVQSTGLADQSYAFRLVSLSLAFVALVNNCGLVQLQLTAFLKNCDLRRRGMVLSCGAAKLMEGIHI